MNATRFFAMTALASALVACGGGGSDTASDGGGSGGGSTVKTGQFVDSPVQGLDYYIDSVKAGTTNAAGEFTYPSGKSVTFRVGNVTLGTTTGADLSTVTPADLTVDPASLTNILVLLQSLDSDANPANGITIPAARAAALTTSLDLSASGTTLASVQASLPSLALVSSSAANSHFVSSVVSNAKVSSEVSRVADSVVGIWYFQCDGNGRKQVSELSKKSNTFFIGKTLRRRYQNSDCTGNYSTELADAPDRRDEVQLLGGYSLPDGRFVLSTSSYSNLTGPEVEFETVTVSADRNSFLLSNSSWQGAITRLSSFDFPQ